jgi:hypothetical protein
MRETLERVISNHGLREENSRLAEYLDPDDDMTVSQFVDGYLDHIVRDEVVEILNNDLMYVSPFSFLKNTAMYNCIEELREFGELHRVSERIIPNLWKEKAVIVGTTDISSTGMGEYTVFEVYNTYLTENGKLKVAHEYIYYHGSDPYYTYRVSVPYLYSLANVKFNLLDDYADEEYSCLWDD